MGFISTKEFNKLTKGADKRRLHELITLAINEQIKMTDAQLLRLVKLKGERNV